MTTTNDQTRERRVCIHPEYLGEITSILLARAQNSPSAAREEPKPAALITRQRLEELQAAGIAYIPAKGVVWKGLFGWWGTCDPGIIEHQASQARRDSRTQKAVLHVSSPGGFTDGVARAADALHALSLEKPVYVVIEDMAASAGQWLAAAPRAEEVIVDPYADLGSIGVYVALLDWSGFAEKQGVVTIVRATGPLKGLHAHDEVSEEYQAEWDRSIFHTLDQFVSHIARGRELEESAVRELATGKRGGGVLTVEEALSAGLVDRVSTETLDELTERLLTESRQTESRQTTSSTRAKGRSSNPTEGDQPMAKPATPAPSGDAESQTTAPPAATTPPAPPAASTPDPLAVIQQHAQAGGFPADLANAITAIVQQTNERQAAADRRDAASAAMTAQLAATRAIDSLGDSFTPAMRFAGGEALLQAAALSQSTGQPMAAQITFTDAEGTERTASTFDALVAVFGQSTAAAGLLSGQRATNDPETSPDRQTGSAEEQLGKLGWSKADIAAHCAAMGNTADGKPYTAADLLKTLQLEGQA